MSLIKLNINGNVDRLEGGTTTRTVTVSNDGDTYVDNTTAQPFTFDAATNSYKQNSGADVEHKWFDNGQMELHFNGSHFPNLNATFDASPYTGGGGGDGGATGDPFVTPMLH